MNFFKPVWFVVALRSEWSHLKSQFQFNRIEGRSVLFKMDQFDQTYLLQTGPGSIAETNFRLALNHKTPQTIIHFGACGALQNHLKCGDIVVPKLLAESTTQKKINLDCDLIFQFTQLLENSNIKTTTGTLVTAPQVISSPPEKKYFGEKNQADIVDMESFFIARYCQQHNIKYLPLRVVFDEQNDDLDQIGEPYTQAGDLSVTKLAKSLATHPKLFLQIPALQRKSKLINIELQKVFSCVTQQLSAAS